MTDDPTQPGTQLVTSITFTDSAPITLADNVGQTNKCTLDNANQATCSTVSSFTYDTGGANDSVTVNGAPAQLPSTNGTPAGCGFGIGNPLFTPTLGPGDDTFNGSPTADQVDGAAGKDNINGGDGPDELLGGGDDDTIHGAGGQDCIDGGAGNDSEFGESGDDSMGNGADSGDDAIDGGEGNDYIDPGPGPQNTSVNNVVTFVSDNDTFTGGPGVDWVDYSNRGSNRTIGYTISADGTNGDGESAHKQNVTLQNGTKQTTDVPAESDNIGGDVENLAGAAGPNTIVGNGADNQLAGNVSNDNIQGLGGNDQIYGDDGDDVIDGGDGNDFVGGCIGNVLVFFACGGGGNGNDAINGGAGDDILDGDAGNDQVNGGDGDDILSGGFGPTRPDAQVPDSDTDLISGGNGEDLVSYADRSSIDPVTVSLDGQPNDGEINVPNRINENDNVGNDVEDVDGGAGADTLTGSAGDNSLNGMGGNDTIVGGDGNDGLYGSSGNDTINAAGKGSTHLDGGDGNDTLVSVDLTRDENQCGAGTDAVSADGRDEVHGDCENVKVTPPAAANIGKASVTKTGYVLVRVTCPATEPRCTGVVTIKTKKRVGKIIIKLGNASYSANGGKTAVVKAVIPPAFREALRKKKKVALAIAVTNVNATTGLSSTTRATRTVRTTILPKKKK